MIELGIRNQNQRKIRVDNQRKISGLTIVEMLVVLFIITIISALILVNYRQGQRRLALENAAQQLTLDIRRAQNMALQAAEYRGGNVPGGYGIFVSEGLVIGNKKYVLFADCDSNKTPGLSGSMCNGASEKLEEIYYGEKIKLFDVRTNLDDPSGAYFVFVPPDPTLWINATTTYQSVSMTLQHELTAQTSTIFVTNTGLVEIQ